MPSKPPSLIAIADTMQSASLPSLPSELLCHISQHLSYGSHLALSLTCRKLYAKVNAPCQPYTLPTARRTNVKPYTMADLIEIENWPEHSTPQSINLKLQSPKPTDLFACRLCMRLRPASKFYCPNKAYVDYGGKLCIHIMGFNHGRFCIPCGINRDRYCHGMQFNMMGHLGMYLLVCNRCGDFELDQDKPERLWHCIPCRA